MTNVFFLASKPISFSIDTDFRTGHTDVLTSSRSTQSIFSSCYLITATSTFFSSLSVKTKEKIAISFISCLTGIYVLWPFHGSIIWFCTVNIHNYDKIGWLILVHDSMCFITTIHVQFELKWVRAGMSTIVLYSGPINLQLIGPTISFVNTHTPLAAWSLSPAI